MTRCAFCAWIPLWPWPVGPLAGQCLWGQPVVVGAMRVLLALCGSMPRGVYLGPHLRDKGAAPRLSAELPPLVGCDRALPSCQKGNGKRRLLRRGTFGERVETYTLTPTRSPSMIHPTPTKTLLTTTFAPLVMQRSGLLARGIRLLDRFVHAEPTPETTMAFERERSALLREVGRRIMAWPLNRLEPDADSEAPSRGLFEGRLSRRRRKHPPVVGTLFGPVTLWRRLYEPRGHRGHSMHPLELRLGIEAGLATPALAERVGAWATDHTPHEVLEIVQRAHGVSWACTSLRKVLGKLRTGMAPQREGAQGKQVLSWIEQARASTGRLRPTLSVGRDGILVPLRGG